MPKPKIVEVGEVRGEGPKGFCVRWKTSDGKNHTCTRVDRALVEAKREELLQAEEHELEEGEGAGGLRLPEADLSTLAGWQIAAAGCADATRRAVLDGDERAQRALRRYSSVLRELSASWAASKAYEELENKLEESIAYVEEMRSRLIERSGTGDASLADPGLGRSDGPHDLICRPKKESN